MGWGVGVHTLQPMKRMPLNREAARPMPILLLSTPTYSPTKTAGEAVLLQSPYTRPEAGGETAKPLALTAMSKST